jgi:hypothetical protein
MSSDLTFITNEENQTLKERFEVLIKDTSFFDCLVGYFYSSGFHAIYHSLEDTEKIRILIGISTSRHTFELLEKANMSACNAQADKPKQQQINLVLSFPPKYSISEVVGFLKGKSAIKIFDTYLELKKRYWGRHFWAKGYCVSTIGLEEERIRKYVRWQLKQDKALDQLKLWK